MKITLVLPKEVETILNILTEAGHLAYVVGGCVRDALLHKEPDDWDITTSALPTEITQCFNEYIVLPTGLQHGTVTLRINHQSFEITTFRIDGEYSDGRRPDSVQFTTSITDDLARRDFTMNAIAYHPEKGIIDPFGGQRDLELKRITCVGKAEQRFTEDSLRIMRGIRFACQLGFTIEQNTLSAMESLWRNLAYVASERVQVELNKALLGSDVKVVFLQYGTLITNIFLLLKPMLGFPQHTPYHIYDVWEHTIVAIAVAPYNLIIRLALLLHDSGKPQTHTVDETGVAHFYQHSMFSKEIAITFLKQLRYSNEITKEVTELVYWHDIQIMPSTKAVIKSLNRFGESIFLKLLAVKKADASAQNPEFGREQIAAIEEVERIYRNIKEEEQCFSLKDLAITGKDIIELGIPAGKIVGELLKVTLQEVLEGNNENQKEVLLAFVKEYLSRINGAISKEEL